MKRLVLIILVASLLLCIPVTAGAKDDNRIVDIAVLGSSTMLVRADGGVEFYGEYKNGYDIESVRDWKDIVSISTAPSHVLGLKRDGTVKYVGFDYVETFDQQDIGKWRKVKKIFAACSPMWSGSFAQLKDDSLVGTPQSYNPNYVDGVKVKDFSANGFVQIRLFKDGTVECVGEIDRDVKDEINSWKNMAQVLTCDQGNAVGLTNDGKLLVAGDINGYLKDAVGQGGIAELLYAPQPYDCRFLAAKKTDGSIMTFGSTESADYDFKQIEYWSDVVKVAANKDHAVGLRSDGGLYVIGNNDKGQCELGDRPVFGSSRSEDAAPVDGDSVVDIAVLGSSTMLVRADGSVEFYGEYKNGYDIESVREWKDISAISAAASHVDGLKQDGTVVSIGVNYTEMFIDGGMSKWREVKKIFSCACPIWSGCYAILEDGSLAASADPKDSYYLEGKNVKDFSANGYINLCLFENGTVSCSDGEFERDTKKELKSWKDIVQVMAVGEGCALGLTKDGKILIAGSDSRFNEAKNWENIRKLLCVCDAYGEGFLAAIKADGSILTCGKAEKAQYDIKAMEGWTDIVKIAANDDHAVGLYRDGTIVSIGKNDKGQCDIPGGEYKGSAAIAVAATASPTPEDDGKRIIKMNPGK